MIKRADELLQGDRVHTSYGIRTVSHTRRFTDNVIRVTWVRDHAPLDADTCHASTEWEIEPPDADAPSKLDLAVQRAQELADQFDGPGVNAREISEMFDLFRAAR